MPFIKIDNLLVLDESNDKNIESNKIRIKINFSVGELEGVLEQTI